MSIFDLEEKTAVNYIYRNEIIQYKFDVDGIAIDEDYRSYCRYLSKVDGFCQPNIVGLPLFCNIRNYVKVVFSDKRPHYGERYDDDSFSDVLILGEYVACDPKFSECIILYINNIRDACMSGISFEHLMLAVYIHELYHAYFKSGIHYIQDVEEPLAEFGALFSLEAMAYMGIIDKDTEKEYLDQVSNKKNKLPKYSFGAYIYEKHLGKTDWCMGVLLSNYRQKVQQSVCTYFNDIATGDPEKWDQAYEDLCKVLNYTD